MKNNVKKAQVFVNILGIHVSSKHISGVLADFERFISYRRIFYVVTPNPELVLMAQKDNMLKKALNSTEFSLPDGMGLVMAARFLLLKAPENKLLRFFVLLTQGLAVGASQPGYNQQEHRP